MRKILLLVSLLLVYSILSFGEEPASSGSGTPEKPSLEEESTISVGGVKIGSFLQYIAEKEKRPIICEDAPIKEATFNIIPLSFKVPSKKYNSVINSILDTTLRMKGYTIIRSDPVWKVVKIAEAREHPSVVGAFADVDNLPYDDRVVTQVIQFKYADAQFISTQLAALKGRGDATYLPIPESNSLIITDYASNIRRYYEILKMVDQEGVSFQTEIRQLKNASSAFVNTNLTQYIQAMQTTVKQRAGVPATTPRTLPDERTNSIIVIALPKDMEPILRMIDLFDSEVSKKDTNYYIYKLTNTNAEDVAKIIDAIFTKQLQPLQTSLKPSEKSISIQAEKSSNSLIITATEEMYNQMVELIKRIDVKKMQVLLEVVIAELTDEKMVELGVELASLKEPSDKIGGFGGTSTGISTPDATNGKTPVIPGGQTNIGSMTLGLWKTTRGNIPFLLRASQKDSGIDLKAAPLLLTNDAAEASINMADMAPYFTTTYPGGGQQPQTTFGGYVQAEMKLKITPYISDDNYIRLVIEQTSEQFLGEPSQSTPKTTRTAKTTVTVPDKDTVVIGGLTREVKSTSIAKVPLFGDIPLLGFLFRRSADSIRKYHLCIFIKPNIMKEFSDLIEKSAGKEREMEKQRDALDIPRTNEKENQ